jgi:hypothetical protein
MMAESNPPWKLSLVAPNQGKKCHQVFPRIGGDTEGAHARATARCLLHKRGRVPRRKSNHQPPHQKHDILILVYDAKATMYSDQTGKFPAVSREGNKYVMVLHDVNSNSLWAEPMKNQTGGELILPATGPSPECNDRDQPKTQNPQQSGIGILQGCHQVIRHDISTSPPR